MLLLVALGMVGCASAPQPEVASKFEVSMVEPVIEPEASQTPDVNEILTVYKEWRGVPYRMGGSSQRGIDCSAFAREVFRNAVGVELPRDTRSKSTKVRAFPNRIWSKAIWSSSKSIVVSTTLVSMSAMANSSTPRPVPV